MEFQRLNDPRDIESRIRWHNENSEYLVIDTETTDKDPRKAELLDIQISSNLGSDHAYIFSGSYATSLLGFNGAGVRPLVAHHCPYDIHVLLRHGVDLTSHRWIDTLILGHLADENRESYSLDSYVQELWNDNYKEEFWSKYSSYQEASEEDRISYACKDIVFTGRLYESLKESLRTQGIPDSLVALVHDLQRHLLSTQIHGIRVDQNYLLTKGVDLKTQINRLLPEMRREVDIYCQMWEMQEYEKEVGKKKKDAAKARVKMPRFSFDSSKQLQTLLYGFLKLPVQTNEKTKSVSTDEASLGKLSELHPLIPKLLEYRANQKVFTTYIEGTESRVDQGRVYPRFNVAGTTTGRLSHSNPNLAQLPRTGGIRGIYIPDPGCVFLSADYSQLEVCVEANLTGDPNLARIFQEGLSKHDITAKGLGVDRTTAKTLNFAMGYHCTHFKVAKILGISEKEGQKVWNKYWDTYYGCRDLKILTDQEINKGMHLVTCFGRRRRFAVKKRSPWDGDYRSGYNFKIQSPGSDITSLAYVRISEKIKQEGWGPGIGWTLHDEPIFCISKSAVMEAEPFILKTMTAIGDEIGFKIPLKAESSGPCERWED